MEVLEKARPAYPLSGDEFEEIWQPNLMIARLRSLNKIESINADETTSITRVS